MEAFFIVVLCAGFHLRTHAATLSDVDRLVKLLNRQLGEQSAVPETGADYPIPGLTLGSEPVVGRYHPENWLPHTGCNYIRDFYEEMYSIPAGRELTDHIVFDSKYKEGLVKAFEKYREIDDPEGAVFLTMRRFVKILLGDELLCPATVLERFILAYMKREEGMLLRPDYDTDSVYTKLVPVLKRIPHIEVNSITPEALAKLCSREVHGRVFNDTMERLLFWSMMDISDFSERLLGYLRTHYREMMEMTSEELHSMVDNRLAEVIPSSIYYCPSFEAVGETHLLMFGELKNGLMNVEKYEICYAVKHFIEKYVPEPSLHGEDETTYKEAITDACNIVSTYIEELAARLEKLEENIKDNELDKFIAIIRPYFETDEMELLFKVLERVGRPVRPGSGSGSGFGSGGLSMSDVIADEEDDVEHWENFIEDLTPNLFEEMTLEELVDVVERWLNEKRKRIERYREHM